MKQLLATVGAGALLVSLSMYLISDNDIDVDKYAQEDSIDGDATQSKRYKTRRLKKKNYRKLDSLDEAIGIVGEEADKTKKSNPTTNLIDKTVDTARDESDRQSDIDSL